MGKKLRHFREDEFRCRCGCGRVKISPALIPALELLRGLVSSCLGRDTPLVILSGYRCPKHNKAVGGVPDSQHLLGTAADIRAPDGITVATLGELATHIDRFGRGGIGQYPSQGFVHVDIRTTRARWVG